MHTGTTQKRVERKRTPLQEAVTDTSKTHPKRGTARRHEFKRASEIASKAYIGCTQRADKTRTIEDTAAATGAIWAGLQRELKEGEEDVRYTSRLVSLSESRRRTLSNCGSPEIAAIIPKRSPPSTCVDIAFSDEQRRSSSCTTSSIPPSHSPKGTGSIQSTFAHGNGASLSSSRSSSLQTARPSTSSPDRMPRRGKTGKERSPPPSSLRGTHLQPTATSMTSHGRPSQRQWTSGLGPSWRTPHELVKGFDWVWCQSLPCVRPYSLPVSIFAFRTFDVLHNFRYPYSRPPPDRDQASVWEYITSLSLLGPHRYTAAKEDISMPLEPCGFHVLDVRGWAIFVCRASSLPPGGLDYPLRATDQMSTPPYPFSTRLSASSTARTPNRMMLTYRLDFTQQRRASLQA
ncbi:hypothetical protein NMY22_g7772 [Coprinellus aureogranulatus]|nr:hypothetical protein NMY22_g7772 [Coprinellus aureogranulatus]